MRHRLPIGKFCPFFRGKVLYFQSICDRQWFDSITENYEVCDQPKLNTSSELNVLVSIEKVCVPRKEHPELLRRQIELTVALVDTCERKLCVRSTWILLRQKPYGFRCRLGCFIKTAQIAVRKSFSKKD